MLWMIADFSGFKDEFSAFYSILSNCENGVDKVTLRNRSNVLSAPSRPLFPNETLLKMKGALDKIFPEKEFFLHNPDEREIELCSHFHFSEKRLGEALKIKQKYPEKKVALSLHDFKNCLKAFEEGIDFAFLSPIYRPISKPDDVREPVKPVNMKNLFLLGGIDKNRAENLINSGYKNIAGISLFRGENAAAIKKLSRMIHEK